MIGKYGMIECNCSKNKIYIHIYNFQCTNKTPETHIYAAVSLYKAFLTHHPYSLSRSGLSPCSTRPHAVPNCVYILIMFYPLTPNG